MDGDPAGEASKPEKRRRRGVTERRKGAMRRQNKRAGKESGTPQAAATEALVHALFAGYDPESGEEIQGLMHAKGPSRAGDRLGRIFEPKAL